MSAINDFAIQRRRNAEEERKKRIFDDKYRSIGVDRIALEKQMMEKRMNEEREKELQKQFDKRKLEEDRAALAKQEHILQKSRQLAQELDRFRMEEQRTDNRRDFDLYDPEKLKKSTPIRISDDDPRCTISSLQIFDGEDLSFEARKKKQKEEFRHRALEKMKENDWLRMRQKSKEADESRMTKSLDLETKSRMDLERQAKRGMRTQLEAFNRQLAHGLYERNEELKRNEHAQNRREAEFLTTSDMLTENPEASRLPGDSNRVLCDRWRGMSEYQLRGIRTQQREQMSEAKMEEERKLALKKQFEEQELDTLKKSQTMARAIDDERHRRRIAVSEKNRKLAEEQDCIKRERETELSFNVPNEEFFDQFNKTSR